MLSELAIAIRARRLKLGLSERRLSQSLKIENAQLRAIEQGLHDPDIQLLLAISQELGWTPAVLMAKAESLALASGQVQRQIVHSIKTRRQIDNLERQHERLSAQLDKLKRQAENLEHCRQLINQSKSKISSKAIDINSINERLEIQRQTFSSTMLRLVNLRHVCDEHDRFMQRTRARKLSIVRN